MTDRKVYIEKMKAKLDIWDADISRLEARAKVAKADMELKYSNEIKRLKKQRKEAAEKLSELQTAGDGAWGDLKAGVESAWDSLGIAVSSAISRFR